MRVLCAPQSLTIALQKKKTFSLSNMYECRHADAFIHKHEKTHSTLQHINCWLGIVFENLDHDEQSANKSESDEKKQQHQQQLHNCTVCVPSIRRIRGAYNKYFGWFWYAMSTDKALVLQKLELKRVKTQMWVCLCARMKDRIRVYGERERKKHKHVR